MKWLFSFIFCIAGWISLWLYNAGLGILFCGFSLLIAQRAKASKFAALIIIADIAGLILSAYALSFSVVQKFIG